MHGQIDLAARVVRAGTTTGAGAGADGQDQVMLSSVEQGALVPVRHLLATSAPGVLGVLGHATPAVAQVLGQPNAVTASTVTSGRLWSVVSALLGLTGAVVGGVSWPAPLITRATAPGDEGPPWP